MFDAWGPANPLQKTQDSLPLKWNQAAGVSCQKGCRAALNPNLGEVERHWAASRLSQIIPKGSGCFFWWDHLEFSTEEDGAACQRHQEKIRRGKGTCHERQFQNVLHSSWSKESKDHLGEGRHLWHLERGTLYRCWCALPEGQWRSWKGLRCNWHH